MIELPESTYHYPIAKKTKPYKDKELEELIQAIFEEYKERYGDRRIIIELRARGYKINHKRVLRIMRQLGLRCLKFTNRSR
ncbi:IS3 family transposase [Aerococcus viridans]